MAKGLSLSAMISAAAIVAALILFSAASAAVGPAAIHIYGVSDAAADSVRVHASDNAGRILVSEEGSVRKAGGMYIYSAVLTVDDSASALWSIQLELMDKGMPVRSVMLYNISPWDSVNANLTGEPGDETETAVTHSRPNSPENEQFLRTSRMQIEEGNIGFVKRHFNESMPSSLIKADAEEAEKLLEMPAMHIKGQERLYISLALLLGLLGVAALMLYLKRDLKGKQG